MNDHGINWTGVLAVVALLEFFRNGAWAIIVSFMVKPARAATKKIDHLEAEITSLNLSNIRVGINLRLRDGWRLGTIVNWLFQQQVQCEVPDLELKPGDPCSLAWLRVGKDLPTARTNCRCALSHWLAGAYLDWIKEEAEGDKRIRLVEHVEQLSQTASGKAKSGSAEGGNLIVRSLLMEAINELCGDKTDPADIARLANAWARTNQAGTEVAKLKLRTQDSVEAGLQALFEEMKDIPQAVAQYQKLREILKRPANPAT